MKTTVRRIKLLIREALREENGVIWGTREELDRSISSMDPETVADSDYVDVETGEVYLEKGQLARISMLHPKHAEDRAAFSSLQNQLDDQEDAAEEAELDQSDAVQNARGEFEAAIAEFASSVDDVASAHPDEDLEGLMSDIADGFFVQNPRWRAWATLLNMSRDDMKTYVAEMAYEASFKR